MTIDFNNMYRGVTMNRPKGSKSCKGDMSFKNSHIGWVMLSYQILQMSSGIVIVSPSDISRED